MRCGPRTFRFILKKYRGLDITDAVADAACKLDEAQGTSPYNLADAFRGRGFAVDVQLNVPWEDLQKWHTMGYVVVLSYLDGLGKADGHYVTLHDITDSHIIVYDTDIGGTISWPRDTWRVQWLDFEEVDTPSKKGYELLERLAIVLKPGTAPLNW